MRMEYRFPVILAMSALLAFTAACGKVSDAQKQDAANLFGGLSGQMGTSGAGYAITAQSPEFASLAQTIRDTAEGAAWTAVLNQEAGMAREVGDFATIGTCPTGSFAGEGAVCSLSCPTTSSLRIGCSFSGTGTTTCSGTTYTISNGTFAVTVDVTGVTGTASSASGSMGLGFDFAADVSGGSLEGKKLECSMNFTVDIAKLKNHEVGKLTPNCSNFSCKYDGKEISCEDISSKMGDPANTCS